MRVLLAAKDSIETVAVTVALRSIPAIEILNFEPNTLKLHEADCAIYIDPQCSKLVLDALRKAAQHVILVSSRDAEAALFLPYDQLKDPSRSLDVIDLMTEYLRKLDQAIKTEADVKEQGGNPVKKRSSPLASTKIWPVNLTKKQKDVLTEWTSGKPEKDVLKNLRMCRRSYFLVLAELRELYGANSNRELLLKINETPQSSRRL